MRMAASVEVTDIAQPALLEDSLMIEVHATSVHPLDNLIRAGYQRGNAVDELQLGDKDRTWDMPSPFVAVSRPDYIGSKFPPHGTFEVSVDGRVLRMSGSGPFNVELTNAYVQKVTPVFAAMNEGGSFGVVIEFHDSMLMSLDAVRTLADFLAKAKNRGVKTVGTAFVVLSSVEGRDTMVSVFRNQVYEPAGVPFKVFDTVLEADQWVIANLK